MRRSRFAARPGSRCSRRARVDVSEQPADFRVAGNSEWRPAKEVDPDAHPEEYISTRVFPHGEDDGVRHGAFLDRPAHTRLITYSRLEDLRAINQQFGRLSMDVDEPLSSGDPVVKVRRTADGLKVVFDDVNPPGDDSPDIPKYKRPWTYMGPGLYQDCGGWILVRLSHTANDMAEIAEYDGETDPGALGLALSTYLPPTVQIGGSPSSVVRHFSWAGGKAQSYPSLHAYGDGQHFKDSQATYPPGFESHGIDEDPQFRSIAPDGSPSSDDDLRLSTGSPAAQAGLHLDGPPTGIVDPLATPSGPQPDLGCYPPGPDSPALEVGVDSRRKFPQHR
jgi:hypothetical protein